MSTLEHRYRRLLRWYPADHRDRHEDEMLGVLLAAAGPDRERPTAREAADLIAGGLTVRLRRLPRGLRGPEWREGTALAATFAALILLGACLRYAVSAAVAAYEARGTGIAPETLYATAPLWAAWAAVAVLALCGARTVASAGVVAVAAVTLTAYLPLDSSSLSAEGNVSVPILLGAVVVAGLLGSDGTPVGPRLLGRRTFAVALCAALGLGLVAVVHAFTWLYLPDEALTGAYLGPAPGSAVALAPIAVALAGGVWLARTPAGRRAAPLLAVPLLPAALGPGYVAYSSLFGAAVMAIVTVPSVLAVLLARTRRTVRGARAAR